MASNEFFPTRPENNPTIYAYTDIRYPNLLKIGYTSIDVEKRVSQQFPIMLPGETPYKVVFSEPAIRSDGTTFMDHDIHDYLKKNKINNPSGEWFECDVDYMKASYIAVRDRVNNIENRTENFSMRPEQEDAVNKTISYYKKSKKENIEKTPKFLWNAKMRFGKTFASYQLAKKLKFKKILVLTFKPAVESAWDDDLNSHIDFEGWQFISKKNDFSVDEIDHNKPLVCFGSFQDLLGVNKKTGGIKTNNEWIHDTEWDLVIFDEYHYGAWRDNSKKLFEQVDEDNYEYIDIEEYKKSEADNAYNESFLPIITNHYLFLSGTPFRAINSGEFIEDQIFNWTYSDEQKAKESWSKNHINPYESLPRMVMMAYRIPDEIRDIAVQGEFNEFDLNVFFSAEGEEEDAKFIYEEHVQKWLNLIRGAHLPSTIDDLKLGSKDRPPMPYSDTRLLNILTHTMWFMPSVVSAYAMKNLMLQKQNIFYHDYKIIVAAGTKAGIGLDAIYPVYKAMDNPLETKTITLSCGKLTTGVTIRPWTGMFMLRNLTSPETYFQAAFRVQSPWVVDGDYGKKEILKKECYVFDFALDRALRQIADYSTRLNVEENDPEKKVGEFVKFLPVLAYDGSTMKEIEASEILDIAMSGTSATLLARRWESALLVNVDNETLSRLISNEEAMIALMSIEGFRGLNKDIEILINKSEKVREAKRDSDSLSNEERKELTQEEKEYKSMRRQIQDKLIKFATRIPIFMYLTDYREKSLKDVITQLEPGLFKKVTGLDVKEFELLVTLGVFNGPIMNDAVYKFKRYEDSSLEYTGLSKHKGLDVGLWDTVISPDDYDNMFELQQASLGVPIAKLNESVIKNQESSLKKKVKNSFKEEDKKSFQYDELIRINNYIIHKQFGKGKITRIDKSNQRITVIFRDGEKQFMYPYVFEKGIIELDEKDGL